MTAPKLRWRSYRKLRRRSGCLSEQSAEAARVLELAHSAVEKLELADALVEQLDAQTTQLSKELS